MFLTDQLVQKLCKDLMLEINSQLAKVFNVLDNPDIKFTLSMSPHARSRLYERFNDPKTIDEISSLLKGVMGKGLCEILYLRGLYTSSEPFPGNVKLIYGNVCAPLGFVSSYIVIRTIYHMDDPEMDMSKGFIINVGN